MTDDMPRWRVGNHNPRNIYLNDVHVAVTVGSYVYAHDLAAAICAAMNDIDTAVTDADA